MLHLTYLIILLPLVGFGILLAVGRRLGDPAAGWVGTIAVIASFAVSVGVYLSLLQVDAPVRSYSQDLWSWIPVDRLQVHAALYVDPLSMTMVLFITGISALIHLYSIGYMKGDKDFPKFFLYMNLFVASMLILVLGSNLLVTFVGWEGVGTCSYWLVSFWFTRDSAASAGKKAFVYNRIGDVGFLLAIFLVWSKVHTFDYQAIFANIDKIGPSNITAICLLLLVGVMGKSAQIPLFPWLADAMEGPTPVSALIHAATMVTAGVYLLCRVNPLLHASPSAALTIAVVGAATAFVAATIACAQQDIKKVLAYSTVSQLGYMFLAIGCGAYEAAIFLMVAHAFFKGLLFLGAGSVMHAMSGELDMRNMGGLRKKTPVTYWTFVIACLAIAGIPGFSGFFSKDEILWKAFSSPHGHLMIWLLGAVTAGMTAFYMFRLLFGTFHGECRASEEVKHHIHESPRIMTVPLMILAVLALVGGYVGVPHLLGGSNAIEQFLAPVFGAAEAPVRTTAAFEWASAAWASGGAAGHESSLELTLMAASVAIALLGIALAYLFYVKNPALPGLVTARFSRLHRWVYNKYFVDELYDFVFVRGIQKVGAFLLKVADGWIIEGLINGTADAVQRAGGRLRRAETGYVQEYAFAIIVGAIIVVGYLVVIPMF
jgi:NADH-quinone oxidoreductase subunit L